MRWYKQNTKIKSKMKLINIFQKTHNNIAGFETSSYVNFYA